MTDAIRPYVPTDEAAVVAVWHRAGQAVYTFLPTWQAFTRAHARQVFADSIALSCDVWVGTDDERVVAFLALKQSYIDRDSVGDGGATMVARGWPLLLALVVLAVMGGWRGVAAQRARGGGAEVCVVPATAAFQPTTTSGSLTAIAASAPHDVWAVGSVCYGSRLQTLVEHWDGLRWRVIPDPKTPAAARRLSGVAAVATDDVWAVGPQDEGLGDRGALIEHWDGRRWQVIPGARSPGAEATLLGIAAVARDDLWAVGQRSGMASRTLVEHWDGRGWRTVASPSPGPSMLIGVAAADAHDVWAVGFSEDEAGRPAPLVEHWDGAQWRVVPSRASGYRGSMLVAVASHPTAGVWAVGQQDNGSTPLIERWDGARWRVVPTPWPGSTDGFLSRVAALSASDAWAVGLGSGDAAHAALAEHWNGRLWREVAVPSPGPATRLAAVAMLSHGDAWAVGEGGPGPWGVVIEHWNGRRWCVVGAAHCQ